MKRVFQIIKLILPSVLMLTFILCGGTDIISALFSLFPLLYIAQGVFFSGREELLMGMLLTTLSFLIPINLCFKVGTGIPYALVYNLLCIGTYWIKGKIKGLFKRS